MESAFYSCVDDTIEDAFDASSDTEPADSDASTSHLPSHTRLNTNTEHTDIDSCNTAADWFTESQRERLSHDNLLQGNSTGIPDGRTLSATAGLRLRQSSADNKYSLTAGDSVQLNSNLAATDVYQSELSRQRTSRCHENLYINKSDTIASRQSLHTESAKSHFPMSSPTLPSSATHLANTVFLPDDKVMEIVEEQLENDDDDDDYSDDDDDDDDDIDDDVRCMMSVKPVDEVDSDAADSEVDEVEEISEDDEDGLAEEEKAVLQEAARAAAEASNDQSTDKTNYATDTAVDDDSVQNSCPQPASDAPRELPSFALGFVCRIWKKEADRIWYVTFRDSTGAGTDTVPGQNNIASVRSWNIFCSSTEPCESFSLDI